METEVQSDEICSVMVVGHKVNLKGSKYVEYRLSVVGTTNYLHEMAFFDSTACVPLVKPVFNVWARYSWLLSVHKTLVLEVKGARLPEFPPKRWVRNKVEGVIRDRVTQLNSYFAELLSLKYVRISHTLSQAFGPKISLSFAVIGCPDVGKSSLVDGFMAASPRHRHRKIEIDPENSQIFSVHRPTDIVVDKALIRLKNIELISLRQDFNPDRTVLDLMRFDAVVLVYAGKETQTPVQELASLLEQPYTVVNLGRGDSYLAGSATADHCDEAYNLFEQLTRRCLSATQSHHRRAVSNL
jgi:hypothetical protein